MLAVLPHFFNVKALHDAEIHFEKFGAKDDVGCHHDSPHQAGEKEHESQVDDFPGNISPGCCQAQHPALIGNHSSAHDHGQKNAAKAVVAEGAVLVITAGISNIRPDGVEQQGHGYLAQYNGGPHEDEHEAPCIKQRFSLKCLLGKGPADEPFPKTIYYNGAGGKILGDDLEHGRTSHGGGYACIHAARKPA